MLYVMYSQFPPHPTIYDEPVVYHIRLEGHLWHHWTEWFDGATITLEENGTTLLSGPVPDQAALFGLLKKVRDLGMPLVSVIRIAPQPSFSVFEHGEK